MSGLFRAPTPATRPWTVRAGQGRAAAVVSPNFDTEPTSTRVQYQEQMIRVASQRQWLDSQQELEKVVREFGALAVTTFFQGLSLEPEGATPTLSGGVCFLGLGFGSGLTAILDLEAMRARLGTTGVGLGMEHFVPPRIREWLRDTSIIKIGAGWEEAYLEAFLPSGVHPTPVVDVLEVLSLIHI